MLPAASWDWFRGDGPPASWVARVTVQGPVMQKTRMIPWEGLVFATWSQKREQPARWARPAVLGANHCGAYVPDGNELEQ